MTLSRKTRSVVGHGLAVFVAGSMLYTGSGLRAPADPVARASVHSDVAPVIRTSPGVYVNQGLFYIYQNIIGPTKGSRCPMAPTCSEYGRLAFKNNGALRGLLLTGDRLHRCGHDLSLYDATFANGRLQHEDSVP